MLKAARMVFGGARRQELAPHREVAALVRRGVVLHGGTVLAIAATYAALQVRAPCPTAQHKRAPAFRFGGIRPSTFCMPTSGSGFLMHAVLSS